MTKGKVPQNLINKRFNRLIVISFSHKKESRYYWNCLCDCGGSTITSTHNLLKGLSQSCGCLQKEKVNKGFSFAARNQVYKSYKAGAKKRSLEFNLTFEQCMEITSRSCYYCGQEPLNDSQVKFCNGNYLYNGLDRVDNTLGYTLENCVPCCKQCNFSKRNLTKNEFQLWLNRIVTNNKEYYKNILDT